MVQMVFVSFVPLPPFASREYMPEAMVALVGVSSS